MRATDGKGHAVNQTWDGVGREHTYVFDLPASLSVIEIDPRGRLVENLPGDNDDLKFDDRQPPRWKFIYNNFGGLLRFFPTLGLDLSLDFSLSRILDLKHGLRFVVYRSESTQVGIIELLHARLRAQDHRGAAVVGARHLARRGAHRPVVRRRRSAPAPTRVRSSPSAPAGATTIGCSCGSR